MLNKQRIVAIIQARIGSSRLPGKTLTNIDGKPLLARIIERIQACTKIDDILVATTNKPEDVEIQTVVSSYGIRSFAGSENDVLDRFYQAAKLVGADVIVRITADDPFKDPQVIDKFISYFLANPEFDFLGEEENNPTFPEGLAVSVFSFNALERAWREAILFSEREHVTPYFLKNAQKFNIGIIRNEQDLSHHRWTIDYEEDLLFTREIYDRLGYKGIFLMEDILDLLETEPSLANINQGIERSKGCKLSLQDNFEMLEEAVN